MNTGRAHPFFDKFAIQSLNQISFDDGIQSGLVGVFFWGHDCPNCEIAKNTLVQHLEELGRFGIRWFDVNVYENSDLGTRFGLMGIPTFIFFRDGKRLGKISPFPGVEPFFTALGKL